MGSLLEVDLARGERVRDVGRELKEGEILPRKAVERNPPRCFTLEDGAQLGGRLDQLFAGPA